MYWVIFDREAKRRHIDVKYTNEYVALEALWDLLRPYPSGHEWRLRLFVKQEGLR